MNSIDSFLSINPKFKYNEVSLKDNDVNILIEELFLKNPYLYKINQENLYNNVLKYKHLGNVKLFSLFEKPSEKSFEDSYEIIDNLSDLKNYMFGNFFNQFILLAIYRFLRTKSPILKKYDLEQKEKKDLFEDMKKLKIKNERLEKLLEKNENEYKFQINENKLLISQLKLKIDDLNKINKNITNDYNFLLKKNIVKSDSSSFNLLKIKEKINYHNCNDNFFSK